MKKFIFGATLLASMSLISTSCGGGESKDVNNDTVFTRSFTDSLSTALGSFMGVNLQDEIRNSDNVADYIEGYQLVAGNKFSYEKLMGIRAGLFVAEQFANMEQQGVRINRDLYLEAFRKYIQQQDINQEEYAALYNNFQNMLHEVDNVLMKREQLRNNAATMVIPADTVPVVVEETVVEETVSDNTADAAGTDVAVSISEELQDTTY